MTRHIIWYKQIRARLHWINSKHYQDWPNGFGKYPEGARILRHPMVVLDWRPDEKSN